MRATKVWMETKNRFLWLVMGLMATLCMEAQAISNVPFISNEAGRFIDSLYTKMTLDERIAQLHGISPTALCDAQGRLDETKCRKYIPNGVGHICQTACRMDVAPEQLRQFIDDLQLWIKQNTPNGIPVMCHDEAISGIAAKGATVYPQQLGMACTWNPSLMERKSKETAQCMKTLGLTMALSPMVDVVRTCTFNRIEESYGEDSYLSGAMGIAFARGLEQNGVAACSKHFLGYGGGSELPEKEITEEILFPHEAIIRYANSKAVMTGYHAWNGVHMVGNSAMIQDFLIRRTGFDGVVVSDYGAMTRLHRGKNPDSLRLCAVDALKAGNVLEFSDGQCSPYLKDALQKGEVSEAEFAVAVKKALALKYRMGLWNEDSGIKNYNLDTSNQRETAYQCAVQSVVMLKNNGILPLKTKSKVALVGPNANSFWSLLGDYSYNAMMAFWWNKKVDGEHPHLVTVKEGMEKQFPNMSYQRGCEWNLPGEASVKQNGDVDPRTERMSALIIQSVEPADWKDAIGKAELSDVIVAVMGENASLCGEARVRKGIALPGEQEKFVRELIATGKPVVLVLMGGRPLILNGLEEHCAAVLHAFYPGEEGGQAIADILSGKVSPSGKLSVSYPAVETETPICYNNQEKNGRVLYPFGYGLSYSKFEYSALNVKKKEYATADSCIDLSFRVKNAGKKPADEIVQIYVSPESGQPLKPVQLKGFSRVQLKAGETRIVNVRLYLSQLAYYSNHGWHVAPGKYSIKVGSSSEDIRLEEVVTLGGREMSSSLRSHLISDVWDEVVPIDKAPIYQFDEAMINGTTGTPLGGFGCGSVKFDANIGQFSAMVTPPADAYDFKRIERAGLQLTVNGKVWKNLKARKTEDNRPMDDAVWPLHRVDFGTMDGVEVKMLGFSPFDNVDYDNMHLPYAFYEVELKNATEQKLEVAFDWVWPSDAVHEWFVGRDAPKGNLMLKPRQKKTIRYVLAWYNRNDPELGYYMNLYDSAEEVALHGLKVFDRLKKNALHLSEKMKCSSLPDWLKNQLLNALCNLTTQSMYKKDGRLAFAEGQWTCFGTMDQMWLSRKVVASLLPEYIWKELSYWARTQMNNGQIHHDMNFENKHEDRPRRSRLVAWDDTEHDDYRDIQKWVDLNCGLIVSVYEIYQMTGDRERFLELWPNVKRAAQRILNQVEAYGNKEYPYTFDLSENSYDHGGNPNPYNAALSAVAYRIMVLLAGELGENEVADKYQKAFEKVTASFQERYVNKKLWQTIKHSENIISGYWLAYHLRLGEIWPKGDVDTLMGILHDYYQPQIAGLGFIDGSYDEWTPYILTHYGGLMLQTGDTETWHILQKDAYLRQYLNRSHVFNHPLDVLPQVKEPNWISTNISSKKQYISIPGIWRNYYDLVGFYRDVRTRELWITPIRVAEMTTTANGYLMDKACFFAPEGMGNITCQVSADGTETKLVVTCEGKMKVEKLHLRDEYGGDITITVNGKQVNYQRIGSGYARELLVTWSGSIGRKPTIITINK